MSDLIQYHCTSQTLCSNLPWFLSGCVVAFTLILLNSVEELAFVIFLMQILKEVHPVLYFLSPSLLALTDLILSPTIKQAEDAILYNTEFIIHSLQLLLLLLLEISALSTIILCDSTC